MTDATFGAILKWGSLFIAFMVLTVPWLVHRRLHRGLPVDVGIWRYTGLHQGEKPGKYRRRQCTNWHIGRAHAIWYMFSLL